jgi:hypothetical protein
MSHFRGVDQRWSADLSLTSRYVTVRAEAIRAKFAFYDTPSLGFRASGYYIQAARFLARRWQAVAKFERFDPNHAVHAANDLTAFTTGLNYYIRLCDRCARPRLSRVRSLFKELLDYARLRPLLRRTQPDECGNA